MRLTVVYTVDHFCKILFSLLLFLSASLYFGLSSQTPLPEALDTQDSMKQVCIKCPEIAAPISLDLNFSDS